METGTDAVMPAEGQGGSVGSAGAPHPTEDTPGPRPADTGPGGSAGNAPPVRTQDADTAAATIDATTYEVLRDRLRNRAAELANRAEELNTARVAAFGSTEMTLTATERLTTTSPGHPRDLVAIGDTLLFGVDPSAALSPRTAVSDVFALYSRELGPLPHHAVPGLLDDPAFVAEFAALCRYYQGARLLRLRRVEDRLLAVFRTGDKGEGTDERADAVRVLRWELAQDGSARFLDGRGDRDLAQTPAYDIEWTPVGRESHVLGRHPHIAIGEDAYVSTVGGSLTIKTDNDTESADGVYREPVDEPLQALADAEVGYARVGALLLLRIRPYKEETRRYLVFNTVTRTVARLDGIGQSCRRLPDDQGIVFPGGYCLAGGEVRAFDVDTAGLEFETAVPSPGGEDVLFVFQTKAGGRALLLAYNTIRKEAASPLSCVGYALFDDGTLVALRDGRTDEPTRIHLVQLWRTPYVSENASENASAAHSGPGGSGPLARIGNADLVRGISDCLSIARQAIETVPTAEVYQALVALCSRTVDRCHWLDDPDTGDLRTPLDEVRATAEQVLEEFTTVQALTRQAADSLAGTTARITRLVRRIRGEAPATAEEWVARIAELRISHGQLLALREMRYADTAAIDTLALDIEQDTASAARRAMAFLQRDDAFAGYHEQADEVAASVSELPTAAATDSADGELAQRAEGLRALTESVTGLESGETTVRTGILERIADAMGAVNRARATLRARRRELLDQEGRAEFTAEFALFAQTVTGALAAADTPDGCDHQLARLLPQLEGLESRFATQDDFLDRITEKRTEVYEAFSARRSTLQDARARRAQRLAESAGRVLESITRRAAALESADAVHAYFASDPMPVKVRRTADELRELGDQVRADELVGRLKAARQEAARALRDRTELFTDGGGTIRLGSHRFAVTTRAPELTLVPDGDGGLAFALTGTDYRAPVTDPAFAATRPYWTRTLPSESTAVYRAEYLAARLLPEAVAGADLPTLVRKAAETSYDEGYERGVHDHDTEKILRLVVRLREGAGLLAHPATARAAAQLFWAHGTTAPQRAGWVRQAVSLARAQEVFGAVHALDGLRTEVTAALARSELPVSHPGAARYLVAELASGESFTTGGTARTLLDKFARAVGSSPYSDDVREQLAAGEIAAAHRLVEGWLTAWADSSGEQADPGDLAEAVAIELCPELGRHQADAPVTGTVTGLLGEHPRIVRGSLTLRLDEFLLRTEGFAAVEAPGFRTYQQLRGRLATEERTRLRLADYQPKGMSAFVRNRLVDEVYLPLIGDSLAKQLGAAGDARRTDSGGLLLLLSPPGYGKTTLVEYVAERLGLLLVKVDGPALGRGTVSLDPAQAPDAAARQEVEKIAFALEAGSNVLLYLDDIQHTSPELLQKFIPLCDATRTLNGRDLRGKRFAVCMAGNPYTESGQRFRIPDMLANRADVWDLGDVLTGKEDAFALSFVENALTSHPVLAPVAGRERSDLELLVRLASGDPTAHRDRLRHPYTPQELDRVLAVLGHLLTARTTVLAVNSAYIASAGQTDATRTEPPFRLQGSYRNLNRIAQRINPVMNAAEVSAVIDDHYAGEARTLTADAEANLLKLAELRGRLGARGAARWDEIKAAYVRGTEGDALGKAVAALGVLAERLAGVESAIAGRGAGPGAAERGPGPGLR
ncbi:DNA repair ATPase [Streptomyces albipurpureus]|uniref:DNA repair ATPase n=1 Tax=Streptomyces albipurpureus TaxID=2897419 RepID=A0ABT0UKG1_9ACTN|nr:DNA repair ATPase [Streptomyces sp. CWNU-1]MCM2388998.1 DNA repair ATPase [Streptomyces sp. CWNU-1]